jgi:hypothetical protein
MNMTKLLLQNYKCFDQETELDIRPLTVLIGANSSGKSVLARAPLLLAHALSGTGTSPLDLAFDGMDFGASFLDLAYDQLPHTAVRLGATFEHNGAECKIAVLVRYFEDARTQVVERFELTHAGNPILMLRWTGSDPVAEIGKYLDDLRSEECQISFRGLMPKLDSPTVGQRDCLEALKQWSGSINYLGPFREEPKRVYPFPESRVDYVGEGGRGAPLVLASDMIRNKRRVLSDVATWYRDCLGGWELDIDQMGQGFALVLTKPSNPNVHVNLADVGTGIAQVLPMVVQRHFDAIHGRKDGLEVVEQPELHLHPHAHLDLADLYVTAVKKTPARFIIETHSEEFLLRIRRRIAERKSDFTPDHVVFYWTHFNESGGATAERIDVKPDGEVTAWPEGVFVDAYKEVMAIRRMQREAAK